MAPDRAAGESTPLLLLGLPAGDTTVFFATAAVIQLLTIGCFLLGRRQRTTCAPA